MDFGLNVSEAVLMDLFNQLSSWADEKLIDGETFYHCSRNKVLDELPFFFSKADTVYRVFKSLEDLKMIDFKKVGRKDYIRLSAKGKQWNKLGNKSDFNTNSEINPSKLGNKSDFNNSTSGTKNIDGSLQNSEINPTDNIYNYTKDKRESRASDFLKENFAIRWADFESKNKKLIPDWVKFLKDFDATVDIEELSFKPRVLFARLEKYAGNWIYNIGKDKGRVVPIATAPQFKRLG